jgi:protein-disulfide isomerase
MPTVSQGVTSAIVAADADHLRFVSHHSPFSCIHPHAEHAAEAAEAAASPGAFLELHNVLFVKIEVHAMAGSPGNPWQLPHFTPSPVLR